MTVNSWKTAVQIVEEAGAYKVEAVFRYRHVYTKDTLYAVFMKSQYIDIYQSPNCECIEKIFELGEWI